MRKMLLCVSEEASMCIRGRAVGLMRCPGGVPAALLLKNPRFLMDWVVVSGARGSIPALPASLSCLPSPAPLKSTFLPLSLLHLPFPVSLPAPGSYLSLFWDRPV